MQKIFKTIILFTVFISLSQAGIQPKVISLAPNITEIIYWLGGESHLAGITTDCDYPPSVRKLPKVGRYTYPDLEKIIALQPALVVLEDTADKRILAKFKKLKIDYKLYNFRKLSGFFAELEKLNSDLGLSGKRKIKSLENKFIKNKARQRRVEDKILILIWKDPYIAAGQGTFLSDYFNWLGYTNIVQTTGYPKISEEILLVPKAEIIFNLSGQSLKRIIKIKTINDLDPNIMLRLSPRLIEYCEKIHS